MKATVLKVRQDDTIRIQLDSESYVEIQVKKLGRAHTQLCVLRPENTTVRLEKNQNKSQKAK